MLCDMFFLKMIVIYPGHLPEMYFLFYFIPFHLKENGHALLLDFISQIEPIIDLKVTDKINYLYSFKDADDAAKEN